MKRYKIELSSAEQQVVRDVLTGKKVELASLEEKYEAGMEKEPTAFTLLQLCRTRAEKFFVDGIIGAFSYSRDGVNEAMMERNHRLALELFSIVNEQMEKDDKK